MIMLAHRGYWLEAEEQNTETAFRRAFDLGFGVETDLRYLNGTLVISHDAPNKKVLSFNSFINLTTNACLPLAINIKEDGLAEVLAKSMAERSILDWYAFDMAIPDMLSYFRADLPTFTRISDIEQNPVCLDEAEGVWLDAFYSDWWTTKTLDKILAGGKKLAIVSPELHNRDYTDTWKILASWQNPLRETVMICTDFPEKCASALG